MPIPHPSRRAYVLAFCCNLALVALRAENPAITEILTADPAALVHEGTVYLYTGHDEAPDRRNGYVMNQWLCFSSTDLVHWQAHGSPLGWRDFAWARGSAWAGHVVERDGKFYWFVPMNHKTLPGFAIGVAVADSPTGPFKDALGKPLITTELTPDPTNPQGQRVTWDDIDPAVFIDDDGQAYIFWGNTNCYWAKLKPNLLELDGPIQTVALPKFTEAPWIHKHGGKYYLTYAYDFPEKTAYAMSDKITGPWEFKGVFNELAGNCNTNHQAIIEYKGRSYFIYHNGGTPTGGSFRRSVCVDYLDYNPDGTLKKVFQTSEGVAPAK